MCLIANQISPQSLVTKKVCCDTRKKDLQLAPDFRIRTPACQWHFNLRKKRHWPERQALQQNKLTSGFLVHCKLSESGPCVTWYYRPDKSQHGSHLQRKIYNWKHPSTELRNCVLHFSHSRDHISLQTDDDTKNKMSLWLKEKIKRRLLASASAA